MKYIRILKHSSVLWKINEISAILNLFYGLNFNCDFYCLHLKLNAWLLADFIELTVQYRFCRKNRKLHSQLVSYYFLLCKIKCGFAQSPGKWRLHLFLVFFILLFFLFIFLIFWCILKYCYFILKCAAIGR